jgi:hypothetical protein
MCFRRGGLPMCQSASVLMICLLRRGGAKRLLLIAEIKHKLNINLQLV